MKFIFISAILFSISAFAQESYPTPSNSADAINGILANSDGLELKSNYEPFIDIKLWDKDTNKNNITFKNTKPIKIPSGYSVSPNSYVVEIAYDDINNDKKTVNTVYKSSAYTWKDDPKVGSTSKVIVKLKENKIQSVTDCSESGTYGDSKYSCVTTSRVLCDYIATRSEKFFRNKADAKKCASYIANLLMDMGDDQKKLLASLEENHSANINEIKTKGNNQNLEITADDNGFMGQLKKKPIDLDQSNFVSMLSQYHYACSAFNMYEKQIGKTRSLHRDESKSTKED